MSLLFIGMQLGGMDRVEGLNRLNQRKKSSGLGRAQTVLHPPPPPKPEPNHGFFTGFVFNLGWTHIEIGLEGFINHIMHYHENKEQEHPSNITAAK